MRIRIAVLVLAVLAIACGRSAPRKLDLYPSPTPPTTQTPIVVEITTTPAPTAFVIVSTTPEPTKENAVFCVSATVAVYLRPSPSEKNYPVLSLPNGSELVDLGGRDGKWYFVSFGDKSGWVNSDYIKSCS